MAESLTPAGSLAGVRVLDFTQLLQGPLATQLLADLGADVVKIEKPGGEWMRRWGIMASESAGETDSFLAFNRNKRSVTVDLKVPEVIQALLESSKDFDVIVENFRPGVMDRLGLGYDDFVEHSPNIVYASSSGYGQEGPYVKRPGQDLLVQALTGALFLTGRRDDPPMPCGVGIADEYTGMHLAVGILAALLHRNMTGQGQRVSVDLFSCMLAAQAQELTVHLNHPGRIERPVENIGHVGATAPFGVYPTEDGHIALALTPCPELASALDQPWLGEYDSNDKMFTNRDEIHRRLSAVLRCRPTSEWLEQMDAADVWCAPVQDYFAVENDAQVAHSGLIRAVPVGDRGETFRTVWSPFKFSQTPPTLRRGVPRAGQHNEELKDELGLG